MRLSASFKKLIFLNLCISLIQDHKMKHMAELQLSVITDADMKQQLSNQVMQYEENMERLYCEQFRLRCYISSLQNGELPNPKVSYTFPFSNFSRFSIKTPDIKIHLRSGVGAFFVSNPSESKNTINSNSYFFTSLLP